MRENGVLEMISEIVQQYKMLQALKAMPVPDGLGPDEGHWVSCPGYKGPMVVKLSDRTDVWWGVWFAGYRYRFIKFVKGVLQ